MSEQIARQFHDVYERLALQFGYETREDTKVFDPQSKNGRLMIAVCAQVIGEIERERDDAREVAENLVEYAHECLVRLESWGKGYDRYEREMETIREAIAGCQKWKEAAR